MRWNAILWQAPLMLALASGCATPGFLSLSQQDHLQKNRVERLLATARDCEAQGRTDDAKQIYQYVLTQHPDSREARDKLNLLLATPATSASVVDTPKVPLQDAQPVVSVESPAENFIAPALSAPLRNPEQYEEKFLAPIALMAEAAHSEEPTGFLPPIPEITGPAVAENPIAPRWQQPVVETSPMVAAVETPAPAVMRPVASERRVAKTERQAGSSKEPVPTLARTEVQTPKSQPAVTAFAPRPAVSGASEIPTLSRSRNPIPNLEIYLAGKRVQNPEEYIAEARPVNSPQPEEIPRVSRPLVIEITPKPTAEPTIQPVVATVNTPAAVSETQLRSSTTDFSPPLVSKTLIECCDDLPATLLPLVQQLESTDPYLRAKALEALGATGPAAKPAVPAIHAMLEDFEPVVAVYAAAALRSITNDTWSSVRTLTRYLYDSDQQIVRLSAYLLGQYGPDAHEATGTLDAVLNSADQLTQLYVAEALSQIAPLNQRAITILKHAISSPDSDLRWFAAVSLGSVSEECSQQAVAALLTALNDEEPSIQAASCLSLGGLGRNALCAIPQLEQAAQSESEDVKFAAETALACLRG